MTMTTTAAMAATGIPGSLQGLIDSRLDTIDRMLLGRMARTERLEIVREVESQIHELLAGGESLTREDVLAVLGRLDPPEAYLPDEFGEDQAPRFRPLRASEPRPASPAGGNRSRLAPTSVILGIVTLVLLILQFPMLVGLGFLFSNSREVVLVLWFLMTVATLAGSVTAIALAVRSGLRQPWAITGLATGIIGALTSLAFVVLGFIL